MLGTSIGSQLANSACSGGLFPQMLACGTSVPLDFAKLLLARTNLAATDDKGLTAFAMAEFLGRLDIASLLELPAERPLPPLPANSVETMVGQVACDLPAWSTRIDLPANDPKTTYFYI